ncbi:hypothetical protein [Nocardia sp. SSK8]|uniref:hypothetical protein n=1 Tax=Nocardia sp. SSK8 TaxID=3120154 RepID=UPI00300A07D2
MKEPKPEPQAEGPDPSAPKEAADAAPAEAASEEESHRDRLAAAAGRPDPRAAWSARVGALGELGGGGFSANNLFLGSVQVDTLIGRDNYARTAGAGLVPSGAVSASMLEEIAQQFVAPPVFTELRRRLREQALLLFRAPQGWGRTTVALHALQLDTSGGVNKLSPDLQLRSLDIEFVPHSGYLCDVLEVDQVRTLREFHLEQLARRLQEAGCRLIVLLDNKARVSHDVEPFVLDGGEPTPALPIVCHHLARNRCLKVLEDPDAESLLVDITAVRPPARDIAGIAAQLADTGHGITVAEINYRRSVSRSSDFQEWFSQLDSETRPFAIALAVFNGMPVHLVSTVGQLLAQRIQREQSPGDAEQQRFVFSKRTAELLDEAQATLYSSTEDTEHGRIPVRAVKYTDDSYPRRVLEHVLEEYHAAHQLIREWLRDLGGFADLDVCTRAGVAVGFLSTLEFDHARQLVIEPWADSGDENEQSAAIGALQFPTLVPELAPLVARMLAAWLHRDQPLARKLTAIAAWGSTAGQQMPDHAIDMLRGMARSKNWAVQDAVGESIIQLFLGVGLTGRVLGELRTWTGSALYSVRETGFWCVLRLSVSMDVDTSRGAVAWPVMVFLAEASDKYRDDVVAIFSRLMDAPIFMPLAFDEVRRWVDLAEKDRELRAPLGRLLIDFGTATQDMDTLAFQLRDWREDLNGPVAAVDDLLVMLDQKRGN